MTQEDAAAMAAVLRDAAAGIGAAQALARAAEEAAANSHLVIAADGSVQAEPVPPQVALQQVPLFISPRLGPQPNPAYQQWQAEIAAIQGQQAQISAVDQALNIAGKNGCPPAYLLGFNTNGNGHAIVSIGDFDTAANTVTYVPGVGSKLTGAYGDTHRAAVLWRQASLYAPGVKIASVYWLGYNAPQLDLSQGLGNAAAAFTNDAVAGAPALLAARHPAQRQRQRRRADPALLATAGIRHLRPQRDRRQPA